MDKTVGVGLWLRNLFIYMLIRSVFSLFRTLTCKQHLIVFVVIALVFLSCTIFASVDAATEQDLPTISLISATATVNPVP